MRSYTTVSVVHLPQDLRPRAQILGFHVGSHVANPKVSWVWERLAYIPKELTNRSPCSPELRSTYQVNNAAMMPSKHWRLPHAGTELDVGTIKVGFDTYIPQSRDILHGEGEIWGRAVDLSQGKLREFPRALKARGLAGETRCDSWKHPQLAGSLSGVNYPDCCSTGSRSS